jgi:hypothetical protein
MSNVRRPEMHSPTSFSREEHLQKRLNAFLVETFSLPAADYYSTLSAKSVVELKSVLSDINNILTLKVTIGFVDWLSTHLMLSPEAKEEARRIVLGSKPNSNGFDLLLEHPVPLVGEVKCNIPINGGTVYGAAQRIGIEKDVQALLNGKLKAASVKTESYLKFLAFLDTPQIRSATEHLARISAVCNQRLVFPLPGESFKRTDVVYVAYVSPGV